jgi:hypothetical protein
MDNAFGEHLDLSTVSPNVIPIEQDMYDLQVRKLKRKEFIYKNGPNTGKPGENFDIKFVVTNDPENSGFSINTTLWASQTTAMYLKRLEIATGIVFEQGTPFDEWAEEVTNEAPIVRMFVMKVPDRKATPEDGGDPPMINIVSWQDVLPEGGDGTDV